MFARSQILASLFAAHAAVWCATAAEKKETPPPPPALPVPQEIQVLRGEEREIPLKVYGRKNQPITFLIRKKPKSGQLSAPINVDSEAAVVRYRPPEDRKVTQDEFLYAARSNEGVSAAVRVVINIVDLPAQLSIPTQNTFAQRLSGTEEVQVIEMENLGGNTAEGEAFVDPPWKIEGPSTYRIEPHGRAFLRVKFAPEKSGKFTGEIRYSSQIDRVTSLRGSAVDAITVHPQLLTLQPELSTLVRAGAVEVTNFTEGVLRIRTSVTEPLRVDQEIVLQPGETRPVVVRTAPGAAAALTGRVTFEAGVCKSDVSVSAEALPPVIRSLEPMINFGQLPSGPSSRFEFALENVGGRSGTVTLIGSGPLRPPTDPVSVAPGQVVPVSVGIAAGTSGTIEAHLEIRGEGNVTQIPVRGGVGIGMPRLTNAPASQAKLKSTKQTSTSGSNQWSPYETDLQRPVDKSRIPKLAGIGPTQCSLEWTKDLAKGPRFIAETRQLGFADGQMVENWLPHSAFRVEQKGDRFLGTIEGIKPGRLYTVRVRPHERGSPPGPVLFQIAFSTPSPTKDGSRFGWKSALVFAGFVWVAIAYWRRRRNPPVPANFNAKKTQKIFD